MICIYGGLLFSQKLKAQENVHLKKTHLSYVLLQMGPGNRDKENASLNNFKTLAPNSIYLNKDFTGYSISSNTNSIADFNFKILTGWQFATKNKTAYNKKRELLLGINIYNKLPYSLTLDKPITTFTDTLISTHTGQTYFLDSTHQENYSMYYSFTQLRLDAAMIYNFYTQKDLQFFIGYGANIGIGFSNYTNINFTSYDNIGSKATGYSQWSNNKYETITNKSNIGYSIYFPIGLDYCLSKTKSFWKQFHINLELQADINSFAIPELTTVYTILNYNKIVGVKFVL